MLDKLNNASITQLAQAIRITETGNNPAQKSSAGALGAMQLLPSTAQAVAHAIGQPLDLGRLLNDVNYNVMLGTAYLGQLLNEYGNNNILGVTAYFAGPGNVTRWLNAYGAPNVTISAPDWLAKISASGNPKSAQYPYSVASHL
jgi:soluble lytic murein transglycosylase